MVDWPVPAPVCPPHVVDRTDFTEEWTSACRTPIWVDRFILFEMKAYQKKAEIVSEGVGSQPHIATGCRHLPVVSFIEEVFSLKVQRPGFLWPR